MRRGPTLPEDDARAEPTAALEPTIARRRFIQSAGAGTVIAALGGLYVLIAEPAYAETRADGKKRVPPGQRVIAKLKDMGGSEGDPSPGQFRLKVHGEVEAPFTLDFRELLAMKQVELKADVHCVTGWTCLDTLWKGVRINDLAKRAKLKKSARYVVFEAAHGYTANVPLRDALADDALVAHRMNGERLPREHGTPVRAVVPDLYFWKSAKWLTGIKFVERDEPGYWEVRGYHNHGDPWREERYG
ncbi:MAG: molybdopterin-dependent oxidoreductase [Polyangiaceae bacterium]